MIKEENIDKNVNEGKEIFNEDNFIQVNSHYLADNYMELINIVYEFFDEMLKLSMKDLSKRDKEFNETDNEFIEDYKNYLYSKFNSDNLNDYNIILEVNAYLYSLRNKSPFFYIFELVQRQIFMIINNLCLDSLILFFNRLIEIYQELIFSNSNLDNI